MNGGVLDIYDRLAWTSFISVYLQQVCVFAGWFTNMRDASAIGRSFIDAVIKAAEKTDPGSDEWDAAAAQPALALENVPVVMVIKFFRSALPLLVAMDLASCSSKIDELTDTLNHESRLRQCPTIL